MMLRSIWFLLFVLFLFQQEGTGNTSPETHVSPNVHGTKVSVSLKDGLSKSNIPIMISGFKKHHLSNKIERVELKVTALPSVAENKISTSKTKLMVFQKHNLVPATKIQKTKKRILGIHKKWYTKPSQKASETEVIDTSFPKPTTDYNSWELTALSSKTSLTEKPITTVKSVLKRKLLYFDDIHTPLRSLPNYPTESPSLTTTPLNNVDYLKMLAERYHLGQYGGLDTEKRGNQKKQYSRKFKYDPALNFMGLGKRVNKYPRNISNQHSFKRIFDYDPALNYMGLGKRYSNYESAIKNMGVGKKESNYDPELKYMGLVKRKFYYDTALKYMGLGKRQSSSHISTKSRELDKKQSTYDPALKYMGLGKRLSTYDPALKYMGLGKRQPDYDPALRHMGLGKRQHNYDPALKYMGLGKRHFFDDPSKELMILAKKQQSVTAQQSKNIKRQHTYNKHSSGHKYIRLGKRKSNYDPALKYMGLGKRQSNYDPALKYMGLGKRQSNYDPALKYMGLGKRQSNYDPALKYMGLGKRQSNYDPALKYMGLGKRQSNYDPALKYMGLGKRQSNYDPALKYMGLGKRQSNYDPALKYMGLGKRQSNYDPALKYMGLGKRQSNYDPALKYMGLGKRQSNYDPALKYMGLGKRQSNYDPALKYMGLGKRQSNYDPALKYMGLGKRQSYYDPALKYMGLGKRYFNDYFSKKLMGLDKKQHSFSSGHKYIRLGKKQSNYDPAFKYMGLGKRQFSYGPAFKHMELGKIQMVYDPVLNYMGSGTKYSNYDPVVQYMGLEKRKNNLGTSSKRADQEKLQSNYDPTLKYMGLGKRQSDEMSKKRDEIYELSSHVKESIQNMVSPEENYGNDNAQDVDDSKQIKNISNENPYVAFLAKRKLNYDPVLKYVSSNKITTTYDSALQNKGLDKDKFKAEKIITEKKSHDKYDPALKYVGLGKRLTLDSRESRKYQPLIYLLTSKFDLRSGAKYDTSISTPVDNNPTEALEKSFVSSIEVTPYLDDNNFLKTILPKNQNSAQSNTKSLNSFLRNNKENEQIFDEKINQYKDASPRENFRINIYKPFILTDSRNKSDKMNCGQQCDSEEVSRSKRNTKYDNFAPKTEIPEYSDMNMIQSYIVHDPPAELFEDYNPKSDDKRDSENRPKYNPGWVFIGLGKRFDKPQYKPMYIDTNEKQERKLVPFAQSQYDDLIEKIHKSVREELKIKNKENERLKKPRVKSSGNAVGALMKKQPKSYIKIPDVTPKTADYLNTKYDFWETLAEPHGIDNLHTTQSIGDVEFWDQLAPPPEEVTDNTNE